MLERGAWLIGSLELELGCLTHTPFEPAPIRNPGPTFQPATQSNPILGQTRAGKLLLHNNRTCADAICCAADSNQRHLLVDALPFFRTFVGPEPCSGSMADLGCGAFRGP